MTACSNKAIKMHVRNVRKIQTIQPMYYYNNKQVQNPLYDWRCEKNRVVKTTRFGIL